MVFQLINGIKEEFATREEMLAELQQLIDDGLYHVDAELVAEEFVMDELEGTKGPQKAKAQGF